MISRHVIALLITLPLLAAGCKDDEPEVAPIDQLPPATRTGQYTFGCLVNGKAFVPDNTNDITAIYQGGGVQIYAQLVRSTGEQEIGIVAFSQITENSSYNLTNVPSQIAEFDWYGVGISTCIYEPEETISGTLTITHFDDEEYIISGTFEFTTATEGCDTIRVTDGRFDIPYIP